MADEQTTTPETPPTPAPLANDTAARTETGEIKDQQKPLTETAKPSTDTPAKTSTEPKPANVAPDKYEFKAPEGYEIDAKFVEKATPILKELGLTNEQGQKLVDLYSAKLAEQAEAPYKMYETMRNDWRTKVFNDPTLGNGSELKPEVKSTINAAIDSLGADASKAFREAMDLTGAGDNPAFIKAMHTWAKALPREGSSVKGGNPSPLGQRAPGEAPKSAATAIYPNLPSSSAS